MRTLAVGPSGPQGAETRSNRTVVRRVMAVTYLLEIRVCILLPGATAPSGPRPEH
jgi:hypothetical protein